MRKGIKFERTLLWRHHDDHGIVTRPDHTIPLGGKTWCPRALFSIHKEVSVCLLNSYLLDLEDYVLFYFLARTVIVYVSVCLEFKLNSWYDYFTTSIMCSSAELFYYHYSEKFSASLCDCLERIPFQMFTDTNKLYEFWYKNRHALILQFWQSW